MPFALGMNTSHVFWYCVDNGIRYLRSTIALIRAASTTRGSADCALQRPHVRSRRVGSVAGVPLRRPAVLIRRVRVTVVPYAQGVRYRQVAVSYTHLRAHETDSYLVCRL